MRRIKKDCTWPDVYITSDTLILSAGTCWCNIYGHDCHLFERLCLTKWLLLHAPSYLARMAKWMLLHRAGPEPVTNHGLTFHNTELQTTMYSRMSSPSYSDCQSYGVFQETFSNLFDLLTFLSIVFKPFKYQNMRNTPITWQRACYGPGVLTQGDDKQQYTCVFSASFKRFTNWARFFSYTSSSLVHFAKLLWFCCSSAATRATAAGPATMSHKNTHYLLSLSTDSVHEWERS